MNCPHCARQMHADRTYADFACVGCGLAGPRDVLEALAARIAPADVLAAAERLLRQHEVHMISLSRIEGVTLWGVGDRKVRSRGTLADAVARLERETGGRDG